MDDAEKAAENGDLKAIAEMFAQLGSQLQGLSPNESLGALARSAVDRVPGARHASITSYVHDSFHTVAATDDVARRADAIQYALGSGPCIDAIVEDTLYRPEDLRHDARWPEYGRRVSDELSIRSMLSYRLGVEVGDAIVGLNIYGRDVAAFGERATLIGLMLATHGALAAALAANEEQVEHLQRALRSNREIGVAMGVLMARHQVTREQAFNLLRLASQDSNRKLHDIALEVVDTGALPELIRRRREDSAE